MCPDTPIILVGTKSDLRSMTNEAITQQELKDQIANYDLSASCETSSKQWRDNNVKKAFYQAAKIACFNKYDDDI